MTAQQLKSSILNLAISGKLVPQDPHDEPASKLVEQIRKEKDRLIKEKKIKPSKFDSVIFKGEDNLHYEKIGKETRCIEDEIPFEIPKSWSWVRLGEISSLITDGTHKTPTYVSNGIPFLTIQNISKGFFDFSTIKYISKEEHECLCRRVRPQQNDILFCRIGTLGEAIKCTLNFDFNIFVSLGLIRLLDARFVDYVVKFINSSVMQKWIEQNKVGGGTHTFKINLGSMYSILLPLPPLSEQKRIVDKLEEILPLVEKYKENKEKLDELNLNFPSKLKKSILDYAIKGKLVEQNLEDESVEILLQKIRQEKQRLIKDKKIKADKFLQSTIFIGEDNSPYEKIGKETRCIADEIPFEIPQSWSWVRLGSMGVAQTGSTPSTQVRDFYGDYMPFIKPADITNSGIDYNNEKLSKKGTEVGRVAEKGSILMVCIGGSLGKCYFNDRIVSFNQQINSLTPFFSSYKFIFYYLLSSHFFEQLQDRATGTATPIVNKTSWESILVPLPPLPEQKRIVAKIEELLKFVDILQSSLK